MMQRPSHQRTSTPPMAWRDPTYGGSSVDVLHPTSASSVPFNSTSSTSSSPSPSSSSPSAAMAGSIIIPGAFDRSSSNSASSQPSSSSFASTAPTASSRPRHHVRSFSAEKRFDAGAQRRPQETTQASSSSFSSSLPPSSHPNGRHASPVGTPSSTNPLPVRAKRSPSIDGRDSISTNGSESPASASSSKPSSATSSPCKEKDVSPERADAKTSDMAEDERLAKLRIAQANRRPRVMRMTPAFSSLPNRMDGPSALLKQSHTDEARKDGTDDSNQIAFPAKISVGGGPSNASGEGDPAKGLQIDLACIPTPSLEDLEGPVTTSRLENLVRDRHGNPIKPSLKTPRSSVSHFMPGRTSRSDSTPALPSTAFNSKSVPTTPTVPKNVHFDSKLEHVKVFKFKQRPTAVSRDGSPEQTETETEEEKDMFPFIWKRNSTGSSPPNDTSPTSPVRSKHSPPPVEEQLVLRLPNFPSSTRLSVDRPVFLERIFLADDLRSVKGTVQVRNMSFEKWVAIRYTLDHWATIGEVSAEYSESIKGGQADRFSFSIKLNELLNWPRGSSALETKSMFICLRYTASKGEYWDNNDGQNYQLDFRRRPMPTTPASTPMAAAATTGPPRASVPDSVASALQAPGTRARVMELARRGVGGKGVFAMEELKRQLEMLRSDDEDEEARTPVISPNEAFRRRASPPHSPGGSQRSGSPSVWTARYDFGQSLRNPRSGSRTTGQGRAAALDYFSAKPMGSPTTPVHTISNSTGSTPPSFTVSAASPPMKSDADLSITTVAPPISSFHARFGMMSPGLGEEHVEHMPVSHGRTSSNTPSPSATPTMAKATFDEPLLDRHQGDRYNSYPPRRHAQSPAFGGKSTPTGPGKRSPAHLSPLPSPTSMDMLRRGSQSPTMNTSPTTTTSVKHEKESSASSSNSTEASSQSSPRSSPPSDGGSPNPFSPSVSISSVESDTTVSNLSGTSADRKSKDVSTSTGATPTPLSLLMAPSAYALGGSANVAGASTTSLQSTVSLQSSSSAGDDDSEDVRLRPASMSDYQELVNRFCWNKDLVPSGGSMVPDMPVHGGLGGTSTRLTDIDGLIPLAAKSSTATLTSGLSSSGGSGASTPTRMH